MISDPNKLFKKQTFQQASYKVLAIETQYLYSRRIFIPNTPIDKLHDGFELVNKITRTGNVSSKEDNQDRSIRRTRGSIRDITQCNKFELFVTFTFSPNKTNRFDIDECKRKMSNWLKNQLKRNGKFEYLIIAEYHKNKALHFHALIKDYPGKVKKAKDSVKNYSFPGFRLGFTNVRKIKQTPDDISRVGNYISKYITKDMVVLFGKNRYWASKTLKRPTVRYNPPEWYKGIKPDWQHVSEYGTTMIFNNEKSDVK